MHSLSKIHSRLLDFILGLQDKLVNVQEDDIKMVVKEQMDVPKEFKDIVMIGDNATIVIGNHNNIHTKNLVKKGDFELGKVTKIVLYAKGFSTYFIL